MPKDVFLLPLLQPKVAQKLRPALAHTPTTRLAYGGSQTRAFSTQTVRASFQKTLRNNLAKWRRFVSWWSVKGYGLNSPPLRSFVSRVGEWNGWDFYATCAYSEKSSLKRSGLWRAWNAHAKRSGQDRRAATNPRRAFKNPNVTSRTLIEATNRGRLLELPFSAKR